MLLEIKNLINHVKDIKQGPVLGFMCILVTLIILFAGLWPRNFDSRNHVDLLQDSNGIRFSGLGIIYSQQPLIRQNDYSNPGSLTVEIAIQADKYWTNYLPSIVAFYTGQPCENIVIGQWKSHLIIRNRNMGSCRHGQETEIGLMNVLQQGVSRFISVTSSIKGTKVYVDGQLKLWRNGLSLLNKDDQSPFQLVLGNYADGKHPWTGTVFSLSIYDQVLSSSDVYQHYQSWARNTEYAASYSKLPIAHYVFNERHGRIIKDKSGNGNELLIPERFAPLLLRILTPPWQDFGANWSYTMDITINVLGFIPFGFYISAYISNKVEKRFSGALIVLFLGISISLFIEIIQTYLPARTSQLMDVITNGTGTAIGIGIWHRFIYSTR